MIVPMAAAGPGTCVNTVGRCNINSPESDVVSIVIVVVIVGLVLFDVVWRLAVGRSGPLSRLVMAMTRWLWRFSPSRRSPRH